MPLISRLFQGDRALDACLVNDSAHLVIGTRGPHVEKIQRAVSVLDGASIAGGEVSETVYGQSTAHAVLAYKQRRQIINRSYQSSADNIVGRMTMAALDGEMARAEQRPPLRGCTTDLGGGGLARALGSRSSVGDTLQLEFPPARLNVAIQEALFVGETVPANSLRTALLVEKATTLLRPFGLRVGTTFLPSFSYPFTVGERDDIDVRGVRRAAERASPDAGGFLRVIFCHLRNTTSTATSQGERTGIEGFRNFVLINKDLSHPDNGTLLHEMIHCSNDRFMNDVHDSDQNSVYSRGNARSLLRDEHARSLNDNRFFKS